MTIILLPPSETKRDGGEPARDDLAPRFPTLVDPRRTVRRALDELVAGSDDEVIARALKVGHRAAAAELARDRALDEAPMMPAIDRYTGVLYDALDAGSLGAAERQVLGTSVLVQSALFGLLSALEHIPAYRLSADSRLPGVSLKRVWAHACTEALARTGETLVDLRSASYAALGPLPNASPVQEVATVSVVARDADGTTRALNHFNKRGKGLFVRDLVSAGHLPATLDDLCARAAGLGWELRRAGKDSLELVVPQDR
ncbi:hypothetical protein EV140_1827 [Microcella alkaliphila]|uniref:Peroxide stress protein YaaA n=1 Tax=Microcella alkaliphila TaxID=279828 RepID=A0A4Q7TFG1_9MICO|nr:peroxide stress protein YaaA [Microcella alkaliphila]RZT59224.1 hypothetical protein EV140_1827 [Microcella alkaliphila]